jgi:hypothetical protein
MMNDSTTRDGDIVEMSHPQSEGRPPAAMPQTNPYLALVETMVSRGGDLANLDRMLDLQIKWEANEAKKAFDEAVAAFKANPPKVYRDKENKQYGSRYTSLANLVNTVNTELSVHGLNARWEADQSQHIQVTCILSHVRGHSERVSLHGPPDTSGAKNTLQQIKSTLTYLKLATFELVTGVASEEGNLDDDGNGANGEDDNKRAIINDWLQVVKDCGTLDELNDRKRECMKAYGMVDKIPPAIRTAFVKREENLA